MVSSTFYEFTANVFHPWIIENHIKLPVLLFLDGHKSHTNVELSTFFSEKGILLYCLLPSPTHIFQPCDVAIFKSLKNQWKKTVSGRKQKTSKSVTKANFAILFKASFDEAIRPEIIREGYKVCELFPYCPDNGDYPKCIPKRRQELQEERLSNIDCNGAAILMTEDYNSALKVIERHMDPNLLNTFRDSKRQDQGQCYSLFEL
nr:unnamed protein product [Callosobruchus analis]